MTPPDEEDRPAPVEADDAVGAEPDEPGSGQVVKDRPGGQRADAVRRLDQAMKRARKLKVHLPHKEFDVDDRVVRRAVRWGQAEDARAATLDEVMKRRRQVERMVRQGKGERLTPGPGPEDEPVTETAESGAGASKTVMIGALLLALVVVSAMVVVALKLL